MIGASSSDLWPSLTRVGIALAVIAVIVGIVVWRGRRRRSKTIALDAALTVFGFWVMLAALGAILIVVQIFTSYGVTLPGAAIPLSRPADVPCDEFGASAAPMLPALLCSGGAIPEPTIVNASLGIRVLGGVAQLCGLALTTVPAAMLAVICFQALRGRPFTQTVTRTLIAGAVAVLVLGIASELLGGIAATAGLREVFDADSEWYPESFQLAVTPLPFLGALALAALAAVFREGMRLQRDTEGLA